MKTDRFTIPTTFGQRLSWDDFTYVRTHPIRRWSCPIRILYAGGDTMTRRPTVDAFVQSHNALLTVYPEGKHWFHTAAQLTALRTWEAENS